MSVSAPSYYPTNHGQDLTDWFVRHGRNLRDLQDLLVSAVFIEKPKEPEQAPDAARFFRGRKFMPALLARALMEDLDILSDPQTKKIYRWEGRFWQEYERDHIEKRALEMLGEEANTARAVDATNQICLLSTLPPGRALNDRKNLICIENGMFNLDPQSGEPLLQAHAKEFYATNMLPIRFDPKSIEDCPRWKQFLEESIKDRATIRELQKFFGYCLTRETRYERMLILYGPGGDGKSTILKMLKALVGAANCSHIPMGRLEDQFYLSKLVDKLLNTFSEVEQKAMQSQEVKAIVSGDPISASFKNQTPFDFEPCCKLAYSTNRPIRMLDNSDGFIRKIMIIDMKQQFVKAGKADEFLEDKLMAELPGIFAWALMGLRELRTDRGFKASDQMQESLKEYKRVNNNVLYFIEKHIEPDPQGREFKFAVYEEYERRCKSWGLTPWGEPNFRTEFLKILRDTDVPVSDQKKLVEDVEALRKVYQDVPRDAGTGKRLNAYGGFRLVEEKDEAVASSPAPPLAVGGP